jgi:hypothetical protein
MLAQCNNSSLSTFYLENYTPRAKHILVMNWLRFLCNSFVRKFKNTLSSKETGLKT